VVAGRVVVGDGAGTVTVVVGGAVVGGAIVVGGGAIVVGGGGAVVTGVVVVAADVVVVAVEPLVVVAADRPAGAIATPTTKSTAPAAPAISLRDGTSRIMSTAPDRPVCFVYETISIQPAICSSVTVSSSSGWSERMCSRMSATTSSSVSARAT
jgi:hypothetical protein